MGKTVLQPLIHTLDIEVDMEEFWRGFEKKSQQPQKHEGYRLPATLVAGGAAASAGSAVGLRKLDKATKKVSFFRRYHDKAKDNVAWARDMAKKEDSPHFKKLHQGMEDTLRRYQKAGSKMEGISRKLRLKNNLLGVLGVAGAATALGGAALGGYRAYKNKKGEEHEA